MTMPDVYLLRAAECARDADAAALANVRSRFHQAESAWMRLAERIVDPERMVGVRRN